MNIRVSNFSFRINEKSFAVKSYASPSLDTHSLICDGDLTVRFRCVREFLKSSLIQFVTPRVD